jgi:outer membrane protein TolC
MARCGGVVVLVLALFGGPLASGEPVDSEPAASVSAELPGILDLATAERIAVADNPSLKAAEDRVKQARARLWQARSAWFPQLEVQASASNTWLSENDYTAARNQVTDGYIQQITATSRQLYGTQRDTLVQGLLGQIPTAQAASTLVSLNTQAVESVTETIPSMINARQAIDDSIENYRVSLILSWIVFNGFERKFANAQARFGLRESEALQLETQRILMSAVAQAYYAAQLAREDIAIAEADQAFNERLLKEAKASRREGAASLSDELNFEVRMNAARTQLIRTRSTYRSLLIALAELLALPEAEFPEETELAELGEETCESLETPSPTPLLDTAFSLRPDLNQSTLAVRRAQAAVGQSRAPFFPTVVASASKDALRTNDFDFGEDDFSTTVGVSVSYTLFAGGRNVAGYKGAKAARSEAERNREQAELAVASEVRRAIEDLTAAQEALVLQRSNALLVQRNRDLVEKEFDAGVVSLVRLNEAQRDLVEAQGTLALARVALQQAWHDVRTATGQTIEAFIEVD